MSAAGVVVREPGEGRVFTIAADRVTVKGSSAREEVDGFSVIEYEGAPGVPGPPMHVHHSFEECWFILAGEVDFHLGEEVRRVGTGGFVLVPRGAVHTFRVAGDVPARWLGIFAPASALGMLEELGDIIPADGPPDMDRLLALFARYQSEVVGPPPGM